MYQQLSVWWCSVFGVLLSAGRLDIAQRKSEQPWLRLGVKVEVSERPPYAARHGKFASGGGQSQMEGRSHSYKVKISSCNMAGCTSVNSISQDIKVSITHILVNRCCSLPLVNIVKWSGFEAPVYTRLVSSSKTTSYLTSALCSWSYFWQQCWEQGKRNLRRAKA